MNYKNKYGHLSTNIRNFYSDGISHMMLSYYKVKLSFLFQPYIGIDSRGLSQYAKQGIMTTLNYELAAGLWKSCYDIIHDSSIETYTLVIPCAGNATLTLEKKAPGEVYLVVAKDNKSIPFKFSSTTTKVKENGVEIIKVIESGLGAFMKTVDGYLSGINADAHLNKLGDDLEKYQEADQHEQHQFYNATQVYS